MADQITLSHTIAEGTLALGDTRPYASILKAYGWRWGRSIAAWYVPHSRDRRPKTWIVDQTARALEAAGVEVVRDISDEAPDVAEREANRAARLDDRRAALTAKAERKAAESAAAFDRARAIGDMIPMGQPILVGHHSESRHRRDLDRIDRSMRTAVATRREAEEAARRAEASAAHERHRMSGPTTLRRIAKLEAERRDCIRKRDRYGEYQTARGTISEMIADLEAEISYWRQHLAQLQADGFRVWGPDDFKPGDYAETRFGPKKVVRVNKKSLTVESGYSWTETLPYDEVRGKLDAALFA